VGKSTERPLPISFPYGSGCDSELQLRLPWSSFSRILPSFPLYEATGRRLPISLDSVGLIVDSVANPESTCRCWQRCGPLPFSNQCWICGSRYPLLWRLAEDALLWRLAEDALLWRLAGDALLWSLAEGALLWSHAAGALLWRLVDDALLWSLAEGALLGRLLVARCYGTLSIVAAPGFGICGP
jgi:hypothetical protein